MDMVRKAYQVASALQHMHSQQAVHQDLHSDNLLSTLDDQGVSAGCRYHKKQEARNSISLSSRVAQGYRALHILPSILSV